MLKLIIANKQHMKIHESIYYIPVQQIFHYKIEAVKNRVTYLTDADPYVWSV